MSLFDANSRDQLRLAYSEAWRKSREGLPLSAQESAIAEVIALHPEYQALIEDPAAALAFESSSGEGRQNPFLHMGLHLAVRDQVGLDRPPGIQSVFRQLKARVGDPHAAEHALMDALGETLWQAQRDGRTPDESHYLALARRSADAGR